MTVFWTWEAYEGCGPKTQPICAIEHCGLATDSRGLCKACFKAWRRYGMAGLQRRAKRLAAGDKMVRTPKNWKDARTQLREAAVLFTNVDAEDDAAYKLADDHLWRVAISCGIATGCVRKAYHVRYKEKWVAKHGLEAWNAKTAARQRAYKARIKAQKGVDTPGG